MNKNVVNESTLILSEVQFSGRCIAKNVRLLKKPTKKMILMMAPFFLVQLGLDNPSQFLVALSSWRLESWQGEL